MYVYQSEFCSESWTKITEEWDYDEFLDMYNWVEAMNDLKKGCEIDYEREEALDQNREQARPRGR